MDWGHSKYIRVGTSVSHSINLIPLKPFVSHPAPGPDVHIYVHKFIADLTDE